MQKIHIYGIKNCKSMKKAFDFLEKNEKTYKFIDYKKTPPSLDFINSLCQYKPLESLINTKGTTYKKLKLNIDSITPEVIIQNPSLIKRPLIIIFQDSHTITQILLGLQDLEKLL